MLDYFLNATTMSTNSLNHIGEKKYKIKGKPLNKIVLVMLTLFIFGFYSMTAIATEPPVVFADEIIEEANSLKIKTLASDIPNSHIKKLRNHLTDVINHLKNGRKKLKKGKNKQAKKQFRKSRGSVRRYIRRLKRKVKNERIDSAVVAPLKVDAKMLKKHITQLIHGHTGNIQSIANAGLDQATQMGQAVMLDGSASSDADGDSLQFRWSIIEQPSNSNAELINPESVTPELVPPESGLYVIELVVSDAESSVADTVNIHVESTNTAPFADAGADQTGHAGDNITLDASASSDAEGDNLAYFWTLVSLPAGSRAALNASDSIMPNFDADLSGLYQAELIVNDGNLDSAADYVDINIDSLNTPPVANSGPDQSVPIGQLVTLDGSASSDVDGDLLTWFWSITGKPSGSTAQLDDDGVVQPTFTPDLEGQYVLQLVVDDNEDSSQADSVIINARKPNTLPIADAGLDQTGYVGDVISLDASASWDADYDNLSFDWSLIAMPIGSGASLDDPNVVSPSFVIDLPGDYVAQLMVNDGQANGAPDEVIITTLNSRPVANAGSDQNLVIGETIQLDGSVSSDADGDALTYHWSISSMPDGSTASLSSANHVNPSFRPDMIGFYVFQLIVNDGVLDGEPATVTLQVNAVEALSLTLTEPTDNLFTNQTEINFRGRLSHKAVLTINNESVSIENDLTFTHLVSLYEGINSFTLNAVDAADSQAQTFRQVTLDTIAPVLPQRNLISVSQPDDNGITTISGSAGSVEGKSKVVIRNNDTNEDVIILADEQGSFSTQQAINEGNSYSLLVQDPAGNHSQMVNLIEGSSGKLPPDPASVAPQLDPTQNTSLHNAISFLYSGSNPIQTGVDPKDIEAQRVAAIRGKVLNRDNTPLSGVTITIKDHLEFGQTLSREDGQFDMVVNGGGLLTINYQKNGYLPVQRKVKSTWRDYARADDVVMIPLDSQVTNIDLSNNQVTQIAQGSVQTDADGSRQATLMFLPGTTAIMSLPDGSNQPLTSLNVRATEYTIGENGLKSMPGPLPATSAYTYAVELSVDEAIAAGATTVEFNQPINVYVDNFLEFPVGELVPAAYYDYNNAAWIPSKNGMVIKIINFSNGLANISLDASNNNASQTELDELGITIEEQENLALLYEPGMELWRVQIDHLTPQDFNWSYGPPLDAEKPDTEEPKVGNEDQPEDPCEKAGCIIEAENQVLGESINITGTQYSLNYRSSRTPGNKTNANLIIPLSGNSIPKSLKAIDLSISVAGQLFQQRFPAMTNQKYTWAWDGRDVFGRELNTTQTATIRIDYVYDTVYYSTRAGLAASFAIFGDRELANRNRGLGIFEVKLSKVFHKKLRKYNAKQAGLGIWSINSHHVYDPYSQTLYKGNGSERSADDIITTVAGNGNAGDSVDGILALDASLRYPLGIAVSQDGTVYVIDQGSDKIKKISKDGIITTVAGTGVGGFSGDGGLAVNAKISSPQGISIGSEGELYIADTGNHRIRKIDRNGIISTIVGSSPGFYGDGGAATEAKLYSPTDLSIGPEGELYIADLGNHRIRRVGTDGVIFTVAGNGQRSFSGDGGSAMDASLNYPRGISVDLDGNLYIADQENYRIRRVALNGIITTIAGDGQKRFSGDGDLAVNASLRYPVDIAIGHGGEIYIASYNRIRVINPNGEIFTMAGNGQVGFSGDNRSPTDAKLNYPKDVAIGQQGELYLSDFGNHRVRRVFSILPKFSSTDIFIPSKDSHQIFHFDHSGRHLRTIDSITGADIYSFSYTTSGLLDTITDLDGDITQIQRNIDGTPNAIIAPYGQVTTLSLDTNGYLAEVTDSLTNSHLMSYDPNGLMTSYSNPNNAYSTYQYDSLGRLLRDINPENGGWVLNRSDSDNGYSVSMTSAEGRSTLFQVDVLSTGDYQRQTTLPNGLVTTQLTKTNGEKVLTRPDGTFITTKEGPDPRFGMLAPVTTDTTIQTPSGLLFSASQSRTAILADSNDPLSVISLTKTSTANGRVSTSQYDATNQTWTGTTTAGRISNVQVDSKGRPVLSQISGLNASSYSYDSRGRLSLITEGNGTLARNTLLNFYQSGPMEGYLQSITNAENQMTSYEYDAMGRVIKQTLPDNREINYAYDANGNLTSLTPPGRAAHIFNYDDLDQSTQYTPPAVSGITTPQTTYTYNRDKQLTQITRPDGQQVTLNYGVNSGKLDSVNLPGGTLAYSYNVETGQINNITALDGGVLSFSYDGFLNTQTQWSGEVNGEISRSYDNDFRIASRSINGTNTINYQYDSDSLLTQVGNLNITRDTQKSGLINGTTLGNLTTSRIYNGFAELSSYNANYAGSDLFDTNYIRDKLGRIIQKMETIDGKNTTTDYKYDLSGRLISETSDNNTIAYTYDSNGNRTHINGNLVASYDEQDRLASYASTDYQYTTNGELQAKIEAGQTTLYHYDVLGNLKQVTLNDGTVIDYVIDGGNRRVGKKINGTLIQGFLYKDQLNPIAELDGNNQIIARFIYASKGNIPDTMIKNGNTYRIISDHLGSPRLVVDIANGSVAQQIDYDTWGNIVNDTNPGFQPFGFAGGIYDQHTNVTRFGVRDYDSVTGRWTAKDPILFNGGDTDLYVYVSNDPVNFIDPSGEFAWGLVFGGINLAWQLHQNGGNLGCVNWVDVGLSMIGGGLSSGLRNGAFKLKTKGSHTWDATRKWMNRRGIQNAGPGQQRHHWLFERNQGVGKHIPDAIKNQPWNINPISSQTNNLLGRSPWRAPLGAPSWAWQTAGGAAVSAGGSGDDCECR